MTERIARPSFLLAAAALLAAFTLLTASHFTHGELELDDASTFLVAGRPLAEIPGVAVSFHSQPPLFYLALHAWRHVGESEAVLRALPMLFMIAAALQLLSAHWLTPLTRLVAAALLLLTPFGDFLTATLRPYSLVVWLALWSTLLFVPLIAGTDRRPGTCARYAFVTLGMAYSVAVASWMLVAQGLCVAVALAAAAFRRGLRGAAVQYGGLVIAQTVIALAYLPYALTVWRLQGALGHPSAAAALAAAFNPRYFVSGPRYLLAGPFGLDLLALAAVLIALWTGARRRDPAIAVCATAVVVQIALTHGFFEGRTGFSFRYLSPAFPALCLLAGFGADRIASWLDRPGLVTAAVGAAAIAGAAVAFARAPRTPPVGPWRALRADLRRFDGAKFVFFDTGWDGQRLQYETRDDPDVRLMTDAGDGWATGGREMTPGYVTRTIDQHAAAGTMFFYEFDPVVNSGAFAESFAPAMARHGCARVYERRVPTYNRAAPRDAAIVYGYACRGR